MPIVVNQPGWLGAAAEGAQGIVGQILKQREEQKQRDMYGSLADSLEKFNPADPRSSISVLQEALRGGAGPAEITPLLGALGKLSPDQNASISTDELSQVMNRMGVPEETARIYSDFYSKLTTGGQTAFVKSLMDQFERNAFGTRMGDTLGRQQVGQEPQQMSSAAEAQGFQFPPIDMFEDRNRKERATLKTQLLKQNNEELKEINKKRQSLDQELARIQAIDRYNESGKLPTGLQNLNINWTTGDIRYPRLASPEAQAFVKTINDFTVAAKDTFGARVTNFELGAFMRRLPTLANSPEGRRIIIQQMESLTALNKLHNDSLREVYDHYGVQNIDRATAEQIAERKRQPQEQKLLQQFADASLANDIVTAKQSLQPGEMVAKSPVDGRIKIIRADQIEQAKQKGYSIYE